jgi:hypothetical protein
VVLLVIDALEGRTRMKPKGSKSATPYAKAMKSKRLKELTPELRREVVQVMKQLAQAERAVVRARHKAGLLVSRLPSGQLRYRGGSIPLIAATIGLDTMNLYAWVANTWSASEVVELMRSSKAKGFPLTWSHLELLALITDKAERAKLVSRWKKAALEVNQLRMLLPMKKIVPGPPSAYPPPPAPTVTDAAGGPQSRRRYW